MRRFHEAKKNGSETITCWGTGSALREFLHADDLGEASVFALENWDPTSTKSPRDNNGYPLEFLNVGTAIELSIRELAEKIAKTINYKGTILWDHSKPDGTPRKLLDVSRLSAQGWDAKISLDDGIARTVEEWRKL